MGRGLVYGGCEVQIDKEGVLYLISRVYMRKREYRTAYIYLHTNTVQSSGDMHVMKLSKTTRNKLLSLILWENGLFHIGTTLSVRLHK